ncbi:MULTISPECIES: LuxR C-terminal-related transcriptional regulator [unclassified Collinsella]|uniref:helix-turn-helix transcriptional regulator n=1 Tax=unclassified Collinsella TaxID=2637548 RepID=UPI00319E1C39
MLLPSIAWSVVTLGLGAIALRLRACSARSIIRGYCAGLFLVWLLSSLFPVLGRALVWGMSVPFVLLALSLAVMAIGAASSARKAEECDEEIADTGRIGTAFEGSGLSPRESEALRLRLVGLSSAKVAVQMGISASTVRNLQSRALDKLRVASIDELRAGTPMDKPHHAGDEASRSWHILLLAVICIAVVVDWALGQDWATDYVAVILLSLCLVFYGFVSPGGGMSRTALRVAPSICFVGWLLGLIPLLALILTLTMVVVRLAGHGVWLLRTPVLAFSCLGLGMLLGGYSSWLVPRLPALLALISNDEAAMACAMLAGLVSGAYVIAGAVSLFLSVRDELEWASSSAGMSADGGRSRRLSAYLVSRGLNETEVDVVMLLVAGCDGAEICSKRCLSPGAVNSARRTAYRKLGIHSLVELVDLCQDAVK